MRRQDYWTAAGIGVKRLRALRVMTIRQLLLRMHPNDESFFLWHVLEGIKWPYSLRSFRHRNYFLYFFGELISLIGTWIQFIAQNWLVYKLSGSELNLGLVNFVALVPLIPLSLWSGSLADRMSKKKILMIAQSLMMLQSLAFFLLTYFGAIQVWHILILSFFLGAFEAIDVPVRQAFVVEMVGKEDLANAIAMNSLLFNSARIIGPSIAGILVALVGEAPAFFLNTISFFALIGMLGVMRLPPINFIREKISMVEHLKEGIRYTLHHRMSWVLISLIGVYALCSSPFLILMPAIVKQFPGSGPEDYGIMMTIVGLGAISGSLMIASLRGDSESLSYLAISNICLPIFLIIFAFNRNFYGAGLLLFLMGTSFVIQNALANTILQRETPDDLRGRVMSLYSLVFVGNFRIGALQSGLVADRTSPFFAIGLGAVFALIYNIFIAAKYLLRKK